MIEEIKYPYDKLTDLERERIDLYRGVHMSDYNHVYVYYYTDMDLGVGYSIIITLEPAKKDKHGLYNFGPTAKDITDEEYFDWKNSFPKVLSTGGNSQKLNDSRDLTLLEQKTLYRQTLTEMKYIVNNYAELITNCAKDKDWVTVSMHVEKMKRTMNSIIEVEIKKL